MGQDVRFSCDCRTVSGWIRDVGDEQGSHVVCHCHDCQAFARVLGHGDEVLDARGGTALFQGRCARIVFDGGLEAMKSLHLTEKPTLRWYAGCCDTPLFNTYANGKLPYLTVLVSALDPTTRDGALGAPVGHLHLADATADTQGLREMSFTALLRLFFPRLIRDWLSGDRRRSPLFDSDTLEPIAKPRRVSDAERAAAA